MNTSDLTYLYSCSAHSKNPEKAGDEFDSKVEKIYNDLKNSSIKRQEDLAYNPNGQLTQIDIWGPEDAEKVLIMIHGGYWLIGNRKKCLAVVPVAQKLGFTVVSVGYDYANKDHPLNKTIEEALDGVQKRKENCHWWAFRRSSFSISRRVPRESVPIFDIFSAVTKLKDPRIRGVFLSSGIYKIQELVHTSYGQDLGLTSEEAETCSCDYDLFKTIQFPILLTNCKIESPKLYQQNLEISHLVPNIQYKVIYCNLQLISNLKQCFRNMQMRTTSQS
ncbi:hypothetical protein CRE_10259 [Caenorhabditis remanei]|uniref:Alpha/beta hydrolase fold-3 domain-containing protein n=1 Tax=Caenorhabditis remanei TaxID=31234 RepID=E3M661_CAERE|nr:hypothetical protein CRE_10259 [Caenorhabditis remanei]